LELRRLKFKLLLANKLIKGQFTFRVSGILVKGDTKNKAFLRFTNKLINKILLLFLFLYKRKYLKN